VPAGRLADLVGRRRLFLIGVAAFVAFSLLCGIATSPEMLTGARVLQAAAGAILWRSPPASWRCSRSCSGKCAPERLRRCPRRRRRRDRAPLLAHATTTGLILSPNANGG
jgi:MFS family permease